MKTVIIPGHKLQPHTKWRGCMVASHDFTGRRSSGFLNPPASGLISSRNITLQTVNAV